MHSDYFAAGAGIITANSYAIHRDRLNKQDQSEALGKLLRVEQDFSKEIEVWQRLPFVYDGCVYSGAAR